MIEAEIFCTKLLIGETCCVAHTWVCVEYCAYIPPLKNNNISRFCKCPRITCLALSDKDLSCGRSNYDGRKSDPHREEIGVDARPQSFHNLNHMCIIVTMTIMVS